jgi:GMP synthase-like glutamine amidotransferase
MRALVIEHEPDVPAALVDEWLSDRGFIPDLYRIATDSLDRDPRGYDLIVTLGSVVGAYDDTVAWVGREQRLLREAFDADVPMLGICFGSQSLARALGGRAMRADRTEIGWIEIDSFDPSLVPAGPWLQWHQDTFIAPPGATVLARSPAGPQAFTTRRSLGVQFHPEVTAELVAAWAAAARDELERAGVDPDRLAAQARAYDLDNRARALALFDMFLDRVARIGAAV